MNKKLSLISTGQAAALCSVTPDTILKWIKAGKINAIATAGGHYRINKNSLQPYTVAESQSPAPETVAAAPASTSCWEYHSDKGKVASVCRKCVVYQSKAERCYVIAANNGQSGAAGTLCKTSCYDCEYFAFIHRPRIKVLIVTADKKFIERFKKDCLKKNCADRLAIHFASSEYETAAALHMVLPNLIVLDATLTSVKNGLTELYHHLRNDSPVHNVRFVLAIRTVRDRRKIPDKTVELLPMPFNSSDIEELFRKAFKRHH